MKSLEDLEKITDECLGVLWLTKTPLSLYSSTGQLLNYLSNGLLGRSYAHHHKNDNKELFCTMKLFGKPFFIFHKKVSPVSQNLVNPCVFSNFFPLSRNKKIVIVRSGEVPLSDSFIQGFKEEFSHTEVEVLEFQDL